MNLSAGLAASSGFFQAQEHAKDQEFLAKQREYQNQVMQAGLASLDDKTRAESAQARLLAAQANAGIDTLPGQTANAIKSNQLQSAGLDFEAQQQPILQGMQASTNRAAQLNQPKQQAISNAGLDASVAQLPELEKARLDSNATQMTARHTQALVDLSRYLSANDKAGALAHVNRIADAESAQAGTRGKKFVNIVASGQKAGDNDSRAFDLVASDGSKVSIPYAAVHQAMAMSKTGKYSMHEGRAGDVHVLNENTGSLETKVPADPNYVRTAGTNPHTPAQLQLVNAYMAAPENKGMTFSQAMEKVKTSMEKPRHQAILELVGKNLLPGADPQKEYQKWADLYDRAKGNTPSAKPGLTSNSSPAPTIDPKYQHLFTP